MYVFLGCTFSNQYKKHVLGYILKPVQHNIPGWTVNEALSFVKLLGNVNNVYLEQPCVTLAEHVAVRDQGRLPLCLDESVCSVADVYEIARQQVANMVQLKIGRLGGITKTKMVNKMQLNYTLTIKYMVIY